MKLPSKCTTKNCLQSLNASVWEKKGREKKNERKGLKNPLHCSHLCNHRSLLSIFTSCPIITYSAYNRLLTLTGTNYSRRSTLKTCNRWSHNELWRSNGASTNEKKCANFFSSSMECLLVLIWSAICSLNLLLSLGALASLAISSITKFACDILCSIWL